MKPRRLSLKYAVFAGTLITVAAMIWFWFTSRRAAAGGIFLVCPGIAFTAMLALGSDQVASRLKSWIAGSPLRIAVAPAMLWVLYLVYATGMRIATVPAMAVMAIYLSAPFVILSSGSKTKSIWRELIAILWLWLPIEFGLIRRLLIATSRPDLHYAFAQMLAIDAGILAFVVWRGVPGVGYSFEYSRPIIRNGLLNFLIYAAIAVPLGISIGFIGFQFTLAKLAFAPAWFAGIFLFTAVPEEFLFRGLIQNWLERLTANRYASLLIAAIIFGASHLNNGSPVPNYKYFLMATIAGIFYGLAWRTTRTITASSITHTLVDTCWSLLFR